MSEWEMGIAALRRGASCLEWGYAVRIFFLVSVILSLVTGDLEIKNGGCEKVKCGYEGRWFGGWD